MVSMKKPCITRSAFDLQESTLRSKLKARLDAVKPIGTPAAGTDVWDKVLPIDSKVVATEIRPIVRERLGALFPLKFIRKGGYESADEVLEDLMPQLRNWCPVMVSTDTESTSNGAAAAPAAD